MKIHVLAAALLLTAAATASAQAPERGAHRMHGGIERFDTDNDGRISRAEFDAGQAQLEARMAQRADRAGKQDKQDKQRDHAPPTFAALDTDRDGYIVRTEVQAYHDRMRPQREADRKARMEQRFTAADLNKDGKLGRVEIEEAMPRMADRFAWLDTNKDGFLTRAELASGHDHMR